MTKSKAFFMLVSIIVLAIMIGFIKNYLIPFSSKMGFGTYSLSRLHEIINASCTTVATYVIPLVIFVCCFFAHVYNYQEETAEDYTFTKSNRNATKIQITAKCCIKQKCQDQAITTDQIHFSSNFGIVGSMKKISN